MIGRLRGVIVERAADGGCVLDVGGVGYDVAVPLGALGRLPAPPEPVTLHVHTHVREDVLALFGFVTTQDRTAFRALLGITGIGPKLAMAILGALDAPALLSAVARSDLGALRTVPGVGKKTAERIALELRDKVLSGALAAAMNASSASPSPSSPIRPPMQDDPLGIVSGALVTMGYKPGEAARAIASIRDASAGKKPDDLLREALVILAG